MRARKVHWTPMAATPFAACGAVSAQAPLPTTAGLTEVTCSACKRTTAFRIALEAEWNAEQWKAWGGE